ncbi:phosphoribosyltransferase [Kribbella pratensis]|jgi:putative phosphoribosyl transferase|uniref:Phosphoribosyltransferase n=1 Tax=Kribbella pratensis TaxID=2512112 RepID=A0A4R8C5J7_9ACTN|nr:phosphoribosyltransferase family protein [Kribbella pratensis]TDW71106.1 putative phosphoribosyltransferase [Kribbella pratensis]
MRRPYFDRAAAGEALADELGQVAGSVLVLGLARGGVPVAAPVADALGAELDVLIVRKLGYPGQPELAMGAIAGVGEELHVVRNEQIARDVDAAAMEEVRQREILELRRRESAYRGDRPPIDVRDRVVILVDDGLATGSTMRAAVEAVRRQRPARVIVAVPVGGVESCRRLARIADQVVCVWIPRYFNAVGQAYRDFSSVSDDEVQRVLAESTARRPGG